MNYWSTLIMDSRHNPLSHIPDNNTRLLIMQILAWIWCVIFSFWMGSIVIFGVSALIHAILLAGIFITFGVFETAKRRPQYFGVLGRGNGGGKRCKDQTQLALNAFNYYLVGSSEDLSVPSNGRRVSSSIPFYVLQLPRAQCITQGWLNQRGSWPWHFYRPKRY